MKWTKHHLLRKSHRNRDKINGTLFCHEWLYGVSRGFSTRAALILLFIPTSLLKACKSARPGAISVALPDDRTNYRIAVGFEICACDDRFVRADWISLKPRREKGGTRKMQLRESRARARAIKIAKWLYVLRNYTIAESELIINLISSI